MPHGTTKVLKLNDFTVELKANNVSICRASKAQVLFDLGLLYYVVRCKGCYVSHTDSGIVLSDTKRSMFYSRDHATVVAKGMGDLRTQIFLESVFSQVFIGESRIL